MPSDSATRPATRTTATSTSPGRSARLLPRPSFGLQSSPALLLAPGLTPRRIPVAGPSDPTAAFKRRLRRRGKDGIISPYAKVSLRGKAGASFLQSREVFEAESARRRVSRALIRLLTDKGTTCHRTDEDYWPGSYSAEQRSAPGARLRPRLNRPPSGSQPLCQVRGRLRRSCRLTRPWLGRCSRTRNWPLCGNSTALPPRAS